MTIANIAILVLATWRLANLLVDDSEDGPWNLLHRIRYLLGVRYDDKNRMYGKHELGKAVTCMWCASLWIGLFVFLFGYYVSLLPLYPFALSAGALWFNKIVKR